MATTSPAKRKKPAVARKTAAPPPEPVLADQVRTMASRMLDAGSAALAANRALQMASEVARSLREGEPMKAAGSVFKAVLPGLAESTDWVRTGAAIRALREAAGLSIAEVGAAIDLKDPSLLEALENGRIALSFELILRLAAVLGRNDPIGFIMKYTRTANPDLWNSLEALGIGKLLLQSAREREFANIYRADDDARSLNDDEFAAILNFTRAAFEMAMALRGQASERADDRPRRPRKKPASAA